MKRAILHILTLLLFSGPLFANTDSLFSKGNALYADGKYEEAIKTYQKIIDEGLESSELYYNLGNSAFRSNKIGFAVLYYKKALKNDPGFEAASKNLSYVSLYLEDKLESVPELFLKRWVKAFYGFFPLVVWSIISISLFVVFLLALLLYIFGSSMWIKKSGFFVGAFTLLLFILSFTAAVKQHGDIKHPNQAVIVAPSVVIKSTPSDSGTDLFVLHEGTSLTTDEIVGEWIEIKIIDGRVGWVKKKALEII
ncbi:tetratricopeptide repeat protein [Bacteroidota bacterium]